METYFAGLELQQILILGLGIVVVGFVLKKLFKLAITIVLILAFVYYGLPIIQTVIAK
ncbi:hypothetical protein [Desulfosporosinus fructosivorans]|uniref:hypothetical protein n=1 Tax=Desulfosporosinus fructosivorans TaxID=2018669 RepID=UPI0018EEAFBE|nr:hypothetical protein [Desulfosporosinus fructosivorans]